jgi:hypothetical protein
MVIAPKAPFLEPGALPLPSATVSSLVSLRVASIGQVNDIAPTRFQRFWYI